MEKTPNQILVELHKKIKSGIYTETEEAKYFLYKDAVENERGKEFVNLLLNSK